MILTKREQDRFFPVINGLIERAGVMLIGRGEIPYPDDPANDDAITQQVLDRLWSDSAVFEDVLAGWAGLSADQRALVESWHSACRRHYLVTFRGGQAYFLAEGYAFAVSGLETPIDKLLSNVPAFVETTLLPFGEKIVYDTVLFEYPVAAMPNMRKMIEDDLDRLISEGNLLRTGGELLERAPEIEAHIAERENERVVREAEEAMRGDEVPEGFHAGELAGLAMDERERALLKEDEEETLKRVIAEVQFDDLASVATPGKPKHALADLLELSTKDVLGRYAKAMGLKRYSKLRKRELAELIAESVEESHELIGAMLDTLSPVQIDALHDIVKAGGTLVVDRERLDVDQLLPEDRAFLCYPFYDRGKLVLVVPDEVVALAGEIDWEGSKKYSLNSQKALDFAEATVRLRGVVYIVDLAFEYQERHHDALSLPEFVVLVMHAVEDERISCELLVPKNDPDDFEESYLLDYSLAGIYRDQAGIVTPGPVMAGEVRGTYVDLVLNEREKVEPRPLMESVDSPYELDDWILALPAVNALVRYLDGHVPDSQHDRAFADDVMMDLIPCMQMGFRSAKTVNGYLDILEDHGFVPTKSMLNRLLDLLMNAANAVPQWPNNGWSANELRDRELAKSGSGRTVFYNEDGSPMKVGRNDPCPCGSGKKYKNCHGKRG